MPASLAAEGFIHCSTLDQAEATANLFYRSRSDLLLLMIDETRLTSPLRYEKPNATDDVRPASRFPHIHGPLNLEAVVRADDFPCEAGGSFRLPASLRGQH